MAETQNDPLLPGYSFNAHLVTGLTPIEAQGYLDFFIDRPLGNIFRRKILLCWEWRD